MRNKPDPCHYCPKTVSRYLKNFLQERKAVLRSESIEPVHRMRVASRRLRAALSVFKNMLTRKRSKIWRKRIRRIGRALGRARQLDVQIKFLKSLGRRGNKPGIVNLELITRPLKKKRQSAQKQIDILLADFQVNKQLPGLKERLEKLSGGGMTSCSKNTFDFRSTVILKRLEQLLAFVPYIAKPQSIKQLHRMRIAAKKLRYTLEIYRPWCGKGFDRYIGSSHDLQDILGDLHEFDCLLRELAFFSKKPGKELKSTCAYLMQECAGRRKAVYFKFVRLWRKLENCRMWESLREEFLKMSAGQGHGA